MSWLDDQNQILADVGYERSDPVHAPSHYTQDGDIECIDAIRAALGRDGFIAFCRGNILKYLWRLLDKHEKGSVDAEKARKYLDWIIEEIAKDVTPR